MDARSILAACLGLALTVVLAGAASAQSGAASTDDDSTPSSAGKMIVFGDQALQRAESVTILRGSAIEPRKASTGTRAERVQLLGGRRLWLVDRATGEVTACASRLTSNVGQRIIQCTSGRVR